MNQTFRWAVIGICIAVAVSLFLPWLRMEVVPVQGRHLPELAAEQYGRGHWLYRASYAIFLLPAIAIWLFWRVLVFPHRRLQAAPVVLMLLVAIGYSAMLLSLVSSPAYNLYILYGLWVMDGAVAGIVLIWVFQYLRK